MSGLLKALPRRDGTIVMKRRRRSNIHHGDFVVSRSPHLNSSVKYVGIGSASDGTPLELRYRGGLLKSVTFDV